MIARNTFLAGKMNKDSDVHLVKPGEYRDALNIRIANSEGNEVGEIEKSLSNKKLTNLSLGTNIKTLGSLRDEFQEKLYWAVKSDLGCYLIEHDVNSGVTTEVLKDTRAGALNVLNFTAGNRIQIVLIIDSDNDNRLMLFTDGVTQPKCINVERAKTYGENGFDEEAILLIKKPPLDAPTITLGETTEGVENNIEEKFLSFAYRYIYLDGEYSAVSPFSEIGFMPKVFNFNYSTGANDCMINNFNKVTIAFDTGSDLITDVEVLFKESGSNNINVIETFNKQDESWGDNTTQTIDFSNSKITRVLPEKELYRLYDNVPLKAKAIAVLKNRVIFGNYTENFNLLDDLASPVHADFDLEIVSTAIVSGTPTKSAKSNRDLEAAIVYLDGYGRMTTPLISENNTAYIPNSDSINQNQLKVTLRNKPPAFAEKFRFFIKQSKTDYEVIIPTLFYEDGVYRWIKMENSDIDKIKEGDSLIVKIDSQGSTNTSSTVKVLEVAKKDANFISNVLVDPLNEGSDISEVSGVYFKIKPDGFRLNRNDFTLYEFEAYDTSSNNYNTPLTGRVAIIEGAIYYGTAGLNDMTSSGTFSGTFDIRYRVQIDTTGAPDTFKWSKDDGATWEATGVAITGVAQTLELGVEVTFAATTGHSTSDFWIVSAKNKIPSDYDFKAYGFFKSIDAENIMGGARISLDYNEYGNTVHNISKTFTASQNYANLEEWFYGDNVLAQLSPLTDADIWFRRGVISDYGYGSAQKFVQDPAGVMVMIVESLGTQNNDFETQAKIRTKLEIFQSEQTVIFETKPLEIDSDIFFEVGKTYDITGGYHVGGDTDQSSGVDGVFTLPFFNCYSWGNGFESYKIRDAFNAKTMKIDTRPSVPVKDYKQNKRIAYVTYSNVYEQSTKYNALNEFNLGLVNFKSLDDKHGSIQKIVPLNDNLDIYTEDKVHRILYEKSTVYSADGTQQLIKSDQVMEITDPYSGEYGISTNPESQVLFGNYSYWADKKRGYILRKGQSGIEVISNFGMKDWFRDQLKTATEIIGGIDPYFNQFTITLNGYTLTFDEKVKGWTSFHSFVPEEMIRVNDRFFTVKDGQLYLHNESENGFNNFYGLQYESKINTIFNQEEGTDKIFKTIVLESISPWEIALNTNLANSTIKKTEFTQDGSKWYASIKKNEDPTDLITSSHGIGNIKSVTSLVIKFDSVNPLVSVGDELYQINGTKELIGVIQKKTDTTITVDAIVSTPVIDLYCYAKKDNRIEGSEIKGFYMEVELSDNSNEANTLFAVGSNMVKD